MFAAHEIKRKKERLSKQEVEQLFDRWSKESVGYRTKIYREHFTFFNSTTLLALLRPDCVRLCRPLAQQEFFTKPKFSHVIELSDCLSTPCSVMHLDMHTLQVKDLEVSWLLAQWELRQPL